MPRRLVLLVCTGVIIGGAVLREVNLLLVLSAMMISPLIFSWRLSMAMVSRLRVARRLPESARVGEPITVELTLVNQRKRLPCWAMITRDQWQARRRAEEPSTNGSRWAGALDVLIPYVPANGQASRRRSLSRTASSGAWGALSMPFSENVDNKKGSGQANSWCLLASYTRGGW